MDARKGSLLEFVAMPMSDEMVMEPPEAVLPLLPSIVTAPPLGLASPGARVKIRWLMTIQKRLTHLLQLLQMSCQPSH
jgi:hypothetical protein